MKPSRIKAREAVKGMAWAGRIGTRIYRKNGTSEPVGTPAPADTAPGRTITAIVFGDPLPGRSALDRHRTSGERR